MVLVSPYPTLEDLDEPDHESAEHLISLARVVGRVVAKPLTAANHVQPLVNGDEAFPAMLAAIESAKTTIALVSYIFDNDVSGEQFANALGCAVKRGVKYQRDSAESAVRHRHSGPLAPPASGCVRCRRPGRAGRGPRARCVRGARFRAPHARRIAAK